MTTRLDFEKPIVELEQKIKELKSFTSREDINLNSEIKKLEENKFISTSKVMGGNEGSTTIVSYQEKKLTDY